MRRLDDRKGRRARGERRDEEKTVFSRPPLTTSTKTHLPAATEGATCPVPPSLQPRRPSGPPHAVYRFSFLLLLSFLNVSNNLLSTEVSASYWFSRWMEVSLGLSAGE